MPTQDTLQPLDIRRAALSHLWKRRLTAIAEHPFVTAETQEKRVELRAIQTELSDRIKQHGYTADVICFPLGSVAVGLAKDWSDLDVAGFIVNPSHPVVTAITIEYSDFLHHENISSVRFSHFRDALNHQFDPERIERGFSKTNNYDRVQYFYAGTIFAPSLNELHDHSEHTFVQRMRRQFFEELLEKCPDKAEKIWDLIRFDFVYTHLVRYEEITWSGKQSHRRDRWELVLTETLENRFSDSYKRQRANRFIEHLRSDFSYPTLSEMCEILDLHPQQV